MKYNINELTDQQFNELQEATVTVKAETLSNFLVLIDEAKTLLQSIPAPSDRINASEGILTMDDLLTHNTDYTDLLSALESVGW